MMYPYKLSALSVLILLSLLTASASAFACVPAKVSLAQRVVSAQAIYIGRVTEVITNVDSKLGINLSISPSPKPYSVNVLVTDIVKGDSDPGNIQPSILNCGSGSASQGDKVIVYLSDGYWYITLFETEMYTEILTLVK